MFAKTVTVMIQEQDYHLAYTVKAMFEIMDLLGEKDLMTVMMDNTGKEYQNLCQMAEIMSKAAEDLLFYEGQATGKVLNAEELKIGARPVDLLALKSAMTQAVAFGYGREVENEEDEVDLGLAELQKKTE